MKKASAGQALVATPIGSAGFQNQLVDLVDRDERQKRLGYPIPKFPLPTPTDTINVKNITGADRRAGEVLEIGTHLLTDIDRKYLAFNADTVSHASGRSYCILERPMTADSIDVAHVSGCCVALVDIQDTSHRYAFVEQSSTILKSGNAGSFKLIGPVTSTGEQEVAVTFGTETGSYFSIDSGGAVNIPGNGSIVPFTWGGTAESGGQFSWNNPELTWNGPTQYMMLDLTCFILIGSYTAPSSENLFIDMMGKGGGSYPTSLSGGSKIIREFQSTDHDTNNSIMLSFSGRFSMGTGVPYKIGAQGIGGSAVWQINDGYWTVRTFI